MGLRRGVHAAHGPANDPEPDTTLRLSSACLAAVAARDAAIDTEDPALQAQVHPRLAMSLGAGPRELRGGDAHIGADLVRAQLRR